MSDADKELNALRARHAELDARKAARDTARLAEDELESERRAVALAEAIDKAETEIGPLGVKIAVIESSEGPIIVKRPPAALFHRYQESVLAKSMSAVENLKLVRPCVVYPALSEFDRMSSELGGLLGTAVLEVARLAGVRMEEVAGK